MKALEVTGAFTGPYRGLEPFDEDAAAFFFGRDREARLIIASLYAAPLTLLYGSSGVGKSSVLRAGVMPRLRKDEEVLPVLFPRLSRSTTGSTSIEGGWQSDPVSGIKETLSLALFESAGTDKALLRQYRDLVYELDMAPLAEFCPACAEISRRRIMIILDQFEEYSLYHPEEDLFAWQFPQALQPGPVSFLLSLREDALGRLDRFKRTIPTLWDSYRRVDHLAGPAAEEAIRRPLDKYNELLTAGEPPVGIEDELVNAVLQQVQTENVQFEERGVGQAKHKDADRIETPYLQLVMTRLWERERTEGSALLRLATLRSEGGAPQIVRTHLDRVMDQFSLEERDVAARVFHRLVTPSGAKIAFTVKDLAEYEAVEEPLLAEILRHLEEGSRRILRRVAVRGESKDEPRYEIFHDRLGDAILAWRTKRLAEQQREKEARKEQEARGLVEASKASARDQVYEALQGLDPADQGIWVGFMFYLVNSVGARQRQTADELARLSQQPLQAVRRVLEYLIERGLLQLVLGSQEHHFEVTHDATAAALLEWHSQYLLHQARGTAIEAPSSHAGELTPARSFPYARTWQLLMRGKLVPVIGSRVALSARPQGRSAGGVPSDGELKEHLAKNCDFPAAELASTSLSGVASACEEWLGRGALDELLSEVFERADMVPSDTHRFLAEAASHAPMTIVATGYDRAMERALRERNVAFDVLAPIGDDRVLHSLHPASGWTEVAESTFLEKYGPRDAAERTLLLRLNGSGDCGHRGTFLITEEDRLRQVRRESWFFRHPGLLQRHLLFLGYAAEDWGQRALVQMLLDERRREGVRAVDLRPSLFSIRFWQARQVEVFNEDLNHWAREMRAAMQARQGPP